MAGVLIRMKLAVLRHSLRGRRLEQMVWGVIFGAAGIYGTFWMGRTTDTLAVLFGLWALGWALGPVLFTGEDKTLQPEHFRSLPTTTRRLAVGLIGASFVGVPAVVTAVAFSALIVRSGSPVAVIAVALELVFVMVLSRVVTSLLRASVQSQLSALLSSMVTGAVMAFFISGWVLIDNFDLTRQLGPAATVARWMPSGWGVVAVDAAGNGQWDLAAAALGGLAVLIVALVLLWAVLLRRRLTTKRTRAGLRRRAGAAVSGSPTASVVRKELLTWSRDYTRGSFVFFAFFYSAFLCGYPAMAGISTALPLVGTVFAVTCAGSCANIYGMDGSALWLTLTRPRGIRADVRGRQLAWTLVVGPIALACTVLAVALTGTRDFLPTALSLAIAATGVGAGAFVFYSVYRLTPMTDPQKRGDDMFDHSLDWLQFIAVTVMVAVLGAPALLGLPFGVATAALSYWGLGWLAIHRLRARGPELLQFMLHGRAQETATRKPLPLPPKQTAAFYVLGFAGVIALFPQGLVPMVIKLTGGTDKVWFLALYLPQAWQWPVIIAMIVVGLACLGSSTWIYLSSKRA